MSERKQKNRAYRSTVVSQKNCDSLEDFKQSFPERFFVRFHMTLLLLGVCASGLLTSKILLELGLRSMLVRYLLAVCVSYVVFFLLMRVWLSYVGADDTPVPDINVGDVSDLGQIPLSVFDGNHGTQDIADAGFNGTGGDFSGGGATDLWGDPSTVSEPVRASVATGGRGSSTGSSSGWSFDLDDEGIVLVALGLLLLVIFGAGAYLVYAAPEILAEAAFEALFAAGLIKASRDFTRKGWIGSVLRATWVPFVLVLLVTGVFGWVAQKNFPHAERLADIFKDPPSDKRSVFQD